MSFQAAKVKRKAVAPCMTCLLCHKLFRDATTIIECLHTFCRKCIHRKLSNEEMECCPTCNINLGCVPLEKLRPDHNLQDVREKIFPDKRIKVKATEVVSPVLMPATRKEKSLSSLVVSNSRVSTQIGKIGSRSKSVTRKASRGANITSEKPLTNEDHPESCSSLGTSNKFPQNTRQNSAAGETSNNPSPDKGKENGSDHWEGIIDLWKPLTCLVNEANRNKSFEFSIQGSLAKSEELSSYDKDCLLKKSKNKGQRNILKVRDEKNCSELAPAGSERRKKLLRFCQKAQDFGEFRVQPQTLLDPASAKFDRRNYPIWFSLVASNELEGDAPPLPQISASYLRIKDGSIPVSFIQKYLKMKLNLTSEVEVDIKCMGQTLIPTLSLNDLVDLWVQTSSTERVSATSGSSAKDFVMVLEYARRFPDSDCYDVPPHYIPAIVNFTASTYERR